MPTYKLERTQVIPTDLKTAWSFFSNPVNLQAITPGTMGFTITSQHHKDALYAGQLIEYKLKPVFGIPVYWMTEITHVVPGKYFIDEQRFGPYAFWHHQHHFREVNAMVEMTDIVHYRIGMGLIGRAAYWLYVRKKLESIFDYRFGKIEKVFQ